MRALLDITDAAYYLHMSADALKDLIKHRQIPYLQRAKKIYLAVADLEEWIAALRVVEVAEAVKAIRVPANLPVPFHSTDHEKTLESTNPKPDIPFGRGRRRHVSAPSVQQRNR